MANVLFSNCQYQPIWYICSNQKPDVSQILMDHVNISGYKFSNLTNLEDLQAQLKANCLSLDMKGSILLSAEGINAFLCGKRESIDSFYRFLSKKNIPCIEFKESLSQDCPFDRMLVKIKPEIIPMGIPEISPFCQPAPTLSPQTFKYWQDQGKEMVILDTRNDYEVQLGKFKNAIDLNIHHFRTFPKAANFLPEEYKNKTIVTYCTGGIRCEKAAPYLIKQGFKDVYQLEGGILNYFEQCGDEHFEGECFVFDKRTALNSKLEPVT